MSHGAPLRHFPTLAALLAAVAAEGFEQLMTTIDDALAAADATAAALGTTVTPRQRLAVSGRAYIRFALADPGVYAVMFRPDRVDVTAAEYQQQGYAAFHQLVDLVATAQADGWQPGPRAEDLAGVLWANVHGIADLTLHGGLAATVGPDAADRLPGLSAALALGLDEPVDHLLGPPSPDPATTSLSQGARP